MSEAAQKRFVAVGDSFTEGVGDIDPHRPNGVRGWADRVAEQLIVNDSAWSYANLAVRGKKLRQVIDEQLEAVVELEPSLITLYAGGNDILRPSVDLDVMMESYYDAVGKLAASGARVLLFTGFDSGKAPLFKLTRGRTAIYNEHVRKTADDFGCQLVDFWHMKQLQDWRYWDVDRLHLGVAGHTVMAKEVLSVLGEKDEIEDPVLPPVPALTRKQKLKEDLRWTREHLAPWIKRRLTGTSSGDSITPKYPQPVSAMK